MQNVMQVVASVEKFLNGFLPAWVSPIVWVILGVAAILLVMYGLYAVMRLAVPKVAAIMATTAKEGAAQPLFAVVLAVGSFLVLLSLFVPYNTFGEDIKVLKDSGLTLVMVLAIMLALWTASVSIAEEIEGRTALTLLSKPIGRRQFVIGKFFGILAPVALLFVILGALFLGGVSYKLTYEAREHAQNPPTVEQCREEMFSIVPGMVLAFLETVVLAAISVAISTRLPMMANLLICFSIYAAGHLVPLLVQSSVGRFEIVRFVGQFLAVVLPVLENFNIQAAVATGQQVPASYLGWAFVYSGLYSTFAILAALFLFEDRDLA